MSQLVLDSSNNLYGTTLYGDSHGFGGVFELSLSSGAWVETMLYSFTGGTDGANPYAGAIFDNSGNLYGTTWKGGYTAGICETQGCGVVFELSASSGVWTETVLYTFLGGTDGAYSQAGLIRDSHDNLYGVTGTGGVSGGCGGEGCGVVFELSNSSGAWTETVLNTFQPGSSGFGAYGGANPYAAVTLDTLGNLYGATHNGGKDGVGVVFEFLLLLDAGQRVCSILSLVQMANSRNLAWRSTTPVMCSARLHTEVWGLATEAAAPFRKSRRNLISGQPAFSRDRLRPKITQISQSNAQVMMKRIGDADGEAEAE